MVNKEKRKKEIFAYCLLLTTLTAFLAFLFYLLIIVSQSACVWEGKAPITGNNQRAVGRVGCQWAVRLLLSCVNFLYCLVLSICMWHCMVVVCRKYPQFFSCSVLLGKKGRSSSPYDTIHVALRRATSQQRLLDGHQGRDIVCNLATVFLLYLGKSSLNLEIHLFGRKREKRRKQRTLET